MTATVGIACSCVHRLHLGLVAAPVENAEHRNGDGCHGRNKPEPAQAARRGRGGGDAVWC